MNFFLIGRSVITNFYILFLLFTQANLTAQSVVKKELAQFLFSDFLTAQIKMNSGPDLTLDINYNTITGKMVFKMGGNFYDMVNPESVDTVYLQQSVFVPYDTVFIELVSEGNVDFFIQHSSYVALRSKPEMKGTAQASSSNYYTNDNSATVNFNQKLPPGFIVKTSNIFRVRIEDKMSEFTNERQLLKIFPDYADQIKKYIKESHIKFDSKPDLVLLGKFCNDLIK
jgi:hypothetical protein